MASLDVSEWTLEDSYRVQPSNFFAWTWELGFGVFRSSGVPPARFRARISWCFLKQTSIPSINRIAFWSLVQSERTSMILAQITLIISVEAL